MLLLTSVNQRGKQIRMVPGAPPHFPLMHCLCLQTARLRFACPLPEPVMFYPTADREADETVACKQGSSAGSGEGELRLSAASHGPCRDLAASSVCPDFWNRRSPPRKPAEELLKSPGSSAECGPVGGAPPRGSALSVRHHRCQPGRGREVHVPPEVSPPGGGTV